MTIREKIEDEVLTGLGIDRAQAEKIAADLNTWTQYAHQIRPVPADVNVCAVTDPQGQQAVRITFILHTGPFVLHFRADDARKIGQAIMDHAADAASGLEVVRNG